MACREALQLHALANRLSELASEMDTNSEVAALRTIGTALYYVAWHAYGVELRAGSIDPGVITNDMNDMTEEVLDEIVPMPGSDGDRCKLYYEARGRPYPRVSGGS